jgi:DNA-binding NarL/FixJ family response regulator
MNQKNSPCRVILADDHVLIRHGIKNIIAREAHLQIVGEVKDGEELLDCLEQNLPELVILDISMPKINGVDLTIILKNKYPSVKILMLTMHTNKQYFYRAMSAGADGYLIKSDSEHELLLAIQKISNGHTYISPLLLDEFTDDAMKAYRNQESTVSVGLTGREKQILALVVDGHTSKDIAAKLNLSPRTVDHHRSSLLRKFKMKNSVDLVNYAVRNGYVVVE